MPQALPALLALSLLLATTPAHAAGAPTRAALQRALEAHQRSAVEVHVAGARGPAAGVFVGASGQVLTAASAAPAAGGAPVELRADGAPVPARLERTEAELGVALLAALAPGAYPSAAVTSLPASDARPWLIGVERGAKGPRPRAARARRGPAPFLDVALRLAPGAPLFDGGGRLVAVVVERRGRGCRAVPVAALRRPLAAHAQAGEAARTHAGDAAHAQAGDAP